jgi:hypothetical protein
MTKKGARVAVSGGKMCPDSRIFLTRNTDLAGDERAREGKVQSLSQRRVDDGSPWRPCPGQQVKIV